MNAIGIDFAEWPSFTYLPPYSASNPTGLVGAKLRPILWDEIQADFVIRRTADGFRPDRGHVADPHPARADRTYLVGGYCVLYPQANMLRQVTNALDMWFRRDGDWDMPYWVDCEVAYTYDTMRVRWQQIDDFCSALEDRIQKTVGIYTRKDWWERHTATPGGYPTGWITRRPLWLALAANMRRDACPRDWWSWTIWQKLFNSRARGVVGDVDINEFSGDANELLAWSRRWLVGGSQ